MENNKKDFLSEITQFRYLMSFTTQILMPFSNYEELAKLQIVDPDSYDAVIAIQKKTANEIILPIIEHAYQIPQPISEEHIRKFIIYFKEALEFVRKDIDIQKFGKLNLGLYEDAIDRIKKQQKFNDETKQSAIDLINILIDYTKNILVIMRDRMPHLMNAIKKIEYDDFEKSLYGTLLTFMCLRVILGVKRFKDEERFSAILESGSVYADDLDSYIDTIDILSNPKEDAEIRDFN